MMQCTPEQIEHKRKIAQEKLQARKLIKTNYNSSPSNPSNLNGINTTNFYQKLNSSNVLPLNSFQSNNLNPIQVNNGWKKIPNDQSHLESKPSSSTINFNTKQNYKELQNTNFNNSKQGKSVQFNGKTITGSCYMISETRFEVNLQGYHVKAIAIFKSLSSRSYDIQTKLWNFHLDDYEHLINKFNLLRPEVVIGRVPQYVINLCKKKKDDYSLIDLSSIDSELLNALMPFQYEGVCFGVSNKGRCLIADDMGLGKTFQALGIAHYYKEDWPLLIVTTASMKNTWEETIHQYLSSVPLMSIQYMVTTKDYINDCQILITSHDMMSRCAEKLSDRAFGVIIIDESHVIKNFKAKCTKSASALAKISRRVILLSGTPALSRPNELYSQLSLIDEKFFGDFFEYSKRYCDGKNTHFGWDSSGKSNLTELEMVLTKKFMIRRTKSQVLQSLPNKTREVIKLDVALEQLSEKQRYCLNTLAENYITKKSDKHSALLSFFSETAKIKIPSVCTYILQLLEGNKKFLVFAHHQTMLDAITKVLIKNDKKFIRIDGNTTSDQRKYFVDKFQLNEDCVCAVLSIMAANAGITMTAAEIVIFAELHWNPSILTQAESRAHRIGQENVVTVRYLIAHGTADDHIWPLLLSKQDVLSEVGLSKDSFKNSTISKQVVDINNDITEKFKPNATSANTKDISQFFVSKTENDSIIIDDTLKEFLEEDDDIFLNVDFSV